MARENLLHVIALCVAAAVLGAASAIGGPNKQLDCSNSYGSATLSTLKIICPALTEDADFKRLDESKDSLQKLEVVETCSCALINHQLAWASMMTHESEILFLAIKLWIDEWDNNHKQDGMPNREKNPLFQGEEGERRYYWDRLDGILQNAVGEDDDEPIADALRNNFADIYYQPGTFKARFASKDMKGSQRLRTLISDTCKPIFAYFANKYLMYFDRLARLSQNDKLLYTLTAYNNDLYKLRMNTKACMYLHQNGHVTYQDVE